jgi:predicted ATPase
MRTAMVRHDAILAAAVRDHEGERVEAGREGDSVLAVFRTAANAAACALEIQKNFSAESWPGELDLKVRVAMHTGEAQLREDHYFGAALNRCARLLAICHPGQILLTKAAESMLSDELPTGTDLLDLGMNRLKDLTRPEQVFQLIDLERPAEFPPIRSPASPPAVTGNIPRPISSFVGRVRDLIDLQQSIQASPLVTLVGPGGIGKTRLAIEACGLIQSQFPDGVWFVDLAAVAGDSQVAGQLASSLAVRTVPNEPLDVALRRSLSNKAALIVLDNCEHVVNGVAQIAATILSASRTIKVLATSREPLGITGEQLIRLDGLAVPAHDSAASVNDLMTTSSVALLVARAPQSVGAEDGATLGEICRRLDGMPLAIELAAARLHTFGPSEVLRRLDDRFGFLTTGGRTADARHRTLQATLDWSFELLADKEQRLLEGLSSFSGGFDLGAVAAVAPVDFNPGEAIDTLASLVEKSLVQRAGPDTYRLLETVKEYAGRRLQQRGNSEDLRRAHFEYFLGIARAVDAELWSARDLALRDQLDVVRDDMRTAMEWGLQTRQRDLLAFVRPLVFYSWTRSQLHDITMWLSSSLNAVPEATPMRVRALLEYGRILGHYTADKKASEVAANEAIRIQDEMGDFSCRSMADLVLAGCYMERGEMDGAAALLEDAIQWGRKSGDAQQLFSALNDSAYTLFEMGDKGPVPLERAREALAIARLHGMPYETGVVLGTLAELATNRGQVADAAALWSECLELGEMYNDIWHTPVALEGSASIARADGDYEAAVLLYSIAAQLRGDANWVMSSINMMDSARGLAELREKLVAPALEELWAAGQRLTRSEAVLLARSVLSRLIASG